MKQFIKLTTNDSQLTQVINVALAEEIYRSNAIDRTTVIFGSGQIIQVKETPDEILALIYADEPDIKCASRPQL
jgi:hypothetical protein